LEGVHAIGEFAGRTIEVRLVVDARARRISVRIDPTRREAIAISPSKRAAPKALAFAAERAHWIAQQLARLPTATLIKPDALVPFRGTDHLLVWEAGRGKAHILEGPPKQLRVPAPEPSLFAARVLRFFKAEAKEALSAAVDTHAATLRTAPSRLSVKDTRSRWGSCTADKALSFSWRVILAPPPVLDYLAAHEVAHLIEMNHSPRFWALVERCVPDYPRHRAWLKQNGAALHAVCADTAHETAV
jgi:predicted metal-dependent hydrolase